MDGCVESDKEGMAGKNKWGFGALGSCRCEVVTPKFGMWVGLMVLVGVASVCSVMGM